jgi:hypothetical protein
MLSLILALVGAGVGAALGLIVGSPVLAVFLGGLTGLFTYLRARGMEIARAAEQNAAAPATRAAVIVPPGSMDLDLGEDLGDLLSGAAHRATRLLEDQGGFDPFVMYVDAGGEVRIRNVGPGTPEATLARARDAARALDASASRLVVVSLGRGEIDGRSRPAVRYEAAERRGRDRTLLFVQPYRGKALLSPAHTTSRPIFAGDGTESLRDRDR